MDSLPNDCVSRLGTKGAVKRQELLARQHPVYDVELDKCHPMTKLEQERFHKFVERRERKNQGQGIIAQVEPAAPVEVRLGACGTGVRNYCASKVEVNINLVRKACTILIYLMFECTIR